MTRFRWGIFGTGAVSAKFVAGLAAARDAEATFVASRSLPKAEEFASAMHVRRAISDYANAAALGGVDAIYVATPPAMHAKHAVLCLEAGIPVLVEKPFANSEAEAQRIADAARSSGIFAMEAMWTRFLPAAQSMRDRLVAGEVGTVRLISGSFGQSQLPEKNRVFDPLLGGGAIAHLGAYPLSLGQWLFGSPVLSQAMGTIGAFGVDEDAAFLLRYPQGVIGSFFVSLRAWALDDFNVSGSDGMISLQGSIVRPHGLNISHEAPRAAEECLLGWRARVRQHALTHSIAQRASRSSRRRAKSYSHRYDGNGYHYEADEVRACIERGAFESTLMPLSDSIATAHTADMIRETIYNNASMGRQPE